MTSWYISDHSFTAPKFDERHFPYEKERSGCAKKATVTREDVQDVPSSLATASVAEAVKQVMTRPRGWSPQPQGALCAGRVDLAC